MDADPRLTNAEVAQLVAMLEDANLVEPYTDQQGREYYRLTEDGVRVGHMLAMVQGEDADTVLQALLSHSEEKKATALDFLSKESHG
jgi:DNA-binding PadR family transcriptional regulator